jgi:hypothetical protein
MRRLLAALALALSLLSPVALPVTPQPGTRAEQNPQTQTSTSLAPARNIIATDAGLAASKIPISLKDAKVKRYTACKVCRPPE